jgi:hypothetical protein
VGFARGQRIRALADNEGERAPGAELMSGFSLSLESLAKLKLNKPSEFWLTNLVPEIRQSW